jgi:large subunit ribosomal protein L37Ae
MAKKSKKTKSAGRFGAKYGKKVRASIILIEEKQRKKQRCPFCGKLGAKRISKGVWQCTRKSCNKKFAAEAYYIE